MNQAQEQEHKNPLRAGLVGERQPEPCAMVIFGATGDLTKRKLVPALYTLARERLLPSGFAIVGFARREIDFATEMRAGVARFARRRATLLPRPSASRYSEPPNSLPGLCVMMRMAPPMMTASMKTTKSPWKIRAGMPFRLIRTPVRSGARRGGWSRR